MVVPREEKSKEKQESSVEERKQPWINRPKKCAAKASSARLTERIRRLTISECGRIAISES